MHTCIMADESVIAGEDDDAHDTTLRKVANRAWQKYVRLNPDKLQLCYAFVSRVSHF